jgi:hypothetical protein
MGKRAAAKRKKIQGEESPETARHPGLPPESNKGRCKVCKRMIDACLIEISRRTPTEGIVTQRAYACREHAAELAEQLVSNLASWTVWSRPTSDEPKTIVEEPVSVAGTDIEEESEDDDEVGGSEEDDDDGEE